MSIRRTITCAVCPVLATTIAFFVGVVGAKVADFTRWTACTTCNDCGVVEFTVAFVVGLVLVAEVSEIATLAELTAVAVFV